MPRLPAHLSSAQLARFERDGALVVPGYFAAAEIARAVAAIDALVARRPRVGHELVYFETSVTDPTKKVLQRIAKFIEEDATLRAMICSNGLAELSARLPTAPGDLIFFDCFAPHQSAPNLTDRPRRNLYLTYNRADAGDYRARYFSEKRASFPPDHERAPGTEYRYKV